MAVGDLTIGVVAWAASELSTVAVMIEGANEVCVVFKTSLAQVGCDTIGTEDDWFTADEVGGVAMVLSWNRVGMRLLCNTKLELRWMNSKRMKSK